MENEPTIVQEPIDNTINYPPINENPNQQETLEPQNNFLVTAMHVDEWEKQYLREGHTYISTRAYLSFIRRFVGHKTLVNQKEVNRFRLKNMNAVCSGALKSFFQFLVHKYDFDENILSIRFDKNKTTKKFPEAPTLDEVEKVIEKVGEYTLRDKMLTITLFEMGLRISEGLKLTWQDVNWSVWLKDRTKQGSVSIKDTKRCKFRTLPASPRLLNLLYDAHLNRNAEGIPIGNLLFDYGIMDYINTKERGIEENKYDYFNYAKLRYSRILNEASLKAIGKKVNPHRLRHALALDMTDKNIPIETIKEFLGHESIVSTQVYTRASSEKLKRDLQTYQGVKSEDNKVNTGVNGQ